MIFSSRKAVKLMISPISGILAMSQTERQVRACLHIPQSATSVTDFGADPLTATATTYDLIYSLDGYHPVSLVL